MALVLPRISRQSLNPESIHREPWDFANLYLKGNVLELAVDDIGVILAGDSRLGHDPVDFFQEVGWLPGRGR